jgi:hypothetical protein
MTIFNKTLIFKGPHRKRREFKTGWMVERTNSGQRLREKKISRRLDPGNSPQQGLQTKQKVWLRLDTSTALYIY